MAYRLAYHPAVRSDVEGITASMRRRIQRAIETRLTDAPDRYGEPLAGTLKGFRKLRVGDYRVVFAVVTDEVRIMAIVHRRDVYQRAERRLR